VALGGLMKLFGGGDAGDDPGPSGPFLEAEGKPTVRLGIDPNREIERVNKLTKDSRVRQNYISYISSLYELVARGDTGPGNICGLVNGLACNHKLLRDEAGSTLMKLAHHFPEVGAEFVRIMEQEGEDVRLNLIKAIFKDMPPRSVAVGLLQRGLADPAERVRYFSVDRIRSCEIRELVPQLLEQRKVEMETKMQRFIDFNIALLVDGFYVEQKPDSGDYLISVSLGGGGVSSATVAADDYSPAAVQQALERLRAEWNRLKVDEQ
jgi:hypothetical protein